MPVSMYKFSGFECHCIGVTCAIDGHGLDFRRVSKLWSLKWGPIRLRGIGWRVGVWRPENGIV